MKIYSKPPKKGVFVPNTKPCTKYMKPFSGPYLGRKHTTNYFLIDYGKIDCTPWDSSRDIWDEQTQTMIKNPKHVKSHWDYKPYWFYVDYFNRPHPNSTKKGHKRNEDQND